MAPGAETFRKRKQENPTRYHKTPHANPSKLAVPRHCTPTANLAAGTERRDNEDSRQSSSEPLTGRRCWVPQGWVHSLGLEGAEMLFLWYREHTWKTHPNS